jgi:hypothetical protein
MKITHAKLRVQARKTFISYFFFKKKNKIKKEEKVVLGLFS